MGGAVSLIAALASRASSYVLPWWARWAVLATASACVFLLGQLHGERVKGAEHNAYVLAQAARTVKIAERQVKVVTRTEIEYRDRIHNVYIKGEEIEKVVDHYITPADDARFGVNVGFLRNSAAAWSGEPAGPATDLDREPAGVPLSEIAADEDNNATSCRVWREQVFGWRAFYARQQVAINGRAGTWFVGTP